jgi:hypothetical protein
MFFSLYWWPCHVWWCVDYGYAYPM